MPPASVIHRDIDPAQAATDGEGSSLWIRGRQLPLDQLVDGRLHDPAYRRLLRSRLAEATPFPHLIDDGWFNPLLLELVLEEFGRSTPGDWTAFRNRHEATHRQLPGTTLGPATQAYINLLHSGWFVQLLSELTGVDHLIPDPQLFGGGLHETRRGGTFDVHRDFDRHQGTGLDNELVFITYLNRDWDPTWGGALELWDGKKKHRVAEIQPAFGRSLLMRHGPASYHGHPAPLAVPEGRTRRSIAAYFYSNRDAAVERQIRTPSVFLFASPLERVKGTLRQVTPPVVQAVGRAVVRATTRVVRRRAAARRDDATGPL